jgi:hypothetical protein
MAMHTVPVNLGSKAIENIDALRASVNDAV